MPTVFDTGPYLQAAVLCEVALTEQDGVVSLIRLVDRITVSAVGFDPPTDMPPQNINLKLVIVLKSGQARSRMTLNVRPEAPSGLQLPAFEAPVFFEGEDRGVNVIVQFQLSADQEGLYWLDILLDAQLLTRVPLRIVYQPQRVSGS